MLPIGDDDTRSGVPLVNLALIAVTVAVFLYQLGSPDFTNGFSMVPREITTGTDLVGRFPLPLPDGTTAVIDEARGPSPIWLTVLSAMFMHGGWGHLGGNMLFLFIFGDNVERAFGHLRYLGFYLASGILATFAQIAIGPDSIIPNLGASGAIAGVLAGYLVLFPANRVRVLIGYFVTSVPAVLMIGLWAVFQFLNGFGSLDPGAAAGGGGVAYFAHIGGFVAGLVLAFLLRPFAAPTRGPTTVGWRRS